LANTQHLNYQNEPNMTLKTRFKIITEWKLLKIRHFSNREKLTGN